MKNIYYLLSGTDKQLGFYDSVKPYLKNDIKNNLIITFIPSYFDNCEINDVYYNNMIKFFNNIDIKFKESYLIDNRVSQRNAKKLINSSDILYIMGGNPYIEMDNIRKYDLIDVIKNFNGIVIGTSAGCINMNEKICYEDEDKTIQYNGIGLTNYNIAPHYDINKNDYINEIERISKIIKTTALPNDSFIRIYNNKSEIIGDYYIYENGKLKNKKIQEK